MSNIFAKQSTEKGDELLQLVSFKIGQEEFGIDILMVQEINRMMNLTRVPNTPDFIEGVINLRGKVIPVVDLRIKLGMPKKEYDKDSRIIVVEASGQTIGFIVDAVREVLRIQRSVTEAPPALVTGIDTSYITAVGKLEDRLLILLDIEKVLSKEELSVLEN